MRKLFRSMYDQIRLDDRKKDELLDKINQKSAGQPEKKRTRVQFRALPVLAAIVLILFSGTVALSASNFSIDHIADSMLNYVARGYTHKEATPEQKKIYENYSHPLGVKVELSDGTYYLDEICYDQTYLHIPFRYYPKNPQNGAPFMNAVQSAPFYFIRKAEIPDDVFLEIAYHDAPIYMGYRHSRDPGIQKDGAITGVFRSNASGPRLRQGDVIQCVLLQTQPPITHRPLRTGEDPSGHRLVIKDGTTYVDLFVPPAVLCEFTLDFEPSVLEFSPEIFAGIPDLVTFDPPLLSSMSLYLSGTYTNSSYAELRRVSSTYSTFWFQDVSIVMKDGSTIRIGWNGSGGSSGIVDDSYVRFEYSILFEAPFNLEDAEYIHFDWTHTADLNHLDLWVPIHP